MQSPDRNDRSDALLRKHCAPRPSAPPPALGEAVVPGSPFLPALERPSLPSLFPEPSQSQWSAPSAGALVKELFVVYDADGTAAGEFIYMTKKFLGLGHCAACDITHGPREEKPEFTQLKKGRGWGVPLVNIHRDEMDASLSAAVGMRLPCVAARTNTRDVLLLGQEALATCEGDVRRFEELVDLALRVHRLVAPVMSEKDVVEEAMEMEVPVLVPIPRRMDVDVRMSFAKQTPTVQLPINMQMQAPVQVPVHMQVVPMEGQMFPKQKYVAEKWQWRTFDSPSEMCVDDDAVVPDSMS